MNKQVSINIETRQTDVYGETDNIQFSTLAKLYKKGDTYYIVYKESEITGMEGTTTTVKVSGRIVTIIRFGQVSSNIVFSQGERYNCSYETAYGLLDMSVKANDVKVDIKENGGEIYIDYDLEVTGEKFGNNSLCLKINGN